MLLVRATPRTKLVNYLQSVLRHFCSPSKLSVLHQSTAALLSKQDNRKSFQAPEMYRRNSIHTYVEKISLADVENSRFTAGVNFENLGTEHRGIVPSHYRKHGEIGAQVPEKSTHEHEGARWWLVASIVIICIILIALSIFSVFIYINIRKNSISH